ncbi:disease resistance protein RGA2-like isoform X1 [Magnolia sinica]|uniref:disease resistance protein RGA2-like isoform X1 n=1 Tax=Magnolia sinica TaxID=86752 RepID=UPI0026597409|nr:disease resistance protein RGA2-like isoform X1 [Magnolia sinica]
MVDSIVDSLVSLAIENLAKVVKDEVVLLEGVTNEIKKLSSTFTSIQAVLKDAETRRLKDDEVKNWLERLKDVAYDVDDILDEWMTETLKSQAPDEDSRSCFSKKKVRSFLSSVNCFNHVVLRHKIGSAITEVRGRLDDIEKDKNQLRLRVDSGERVDSEVRRGEIRERETGSLPNRLSIVGREDEKNKILEFLLGESSGEVEKVYAVISIVGMGGLGKTTLAQLAYNDEEVKKHFDTRMWVCVSEDFDVKRITKSSIESATGTGCESLDLAPLQDHLRRMLHSKRFLLVLDDVWSTNNEMWDKLIPPYQEGARGSRIIVTTRSEDVARAMGRGRIHKLASLSFDDCWLLFSHGALEHRSAEERSELDVIGKEIVKKCGGVPLAAKTIGSALGSRRTRREWELILESDVWNSHDVLQGILPALLLSYYDLPPALKQCFAYFSVFPKDWEIEKDMIVKLWVAQGFIRSDRSRDMEEIGGLYFDDLLRRSLLQDAELHYVQKYKMHDLVHDLAQSVAGSECSVVEMRKQSSLNLNNLRHLFLIDSDDAGDSDEEVDSDGAGDRDDKVDSDGADWATLYKAQKLRTLLLYSRKVPNNLFHHFRHLRALDLSRTSIQKLPRTVGNLKHLRYLDLSWTKIEKLPEEVSNCRNLQTLRLNDCHDLKKLPRGLRKMIGLRHLELESTYNLKDLPQGIGKLSSLRTLTKFIVGGDREGCKWGELKHLNHLQGSLEINWLKNVRSRDEAREGELNKKQNLNELSLDYGYTELNEDVFEILQPHTNLKVLEIQRYGVSKLPKWTGDPVFSNLVKVYLSFCYKCTQLPGLGKLPSLKYLDISFLEEVRKVGGEFCRDDNNDESGGGGGVSFPKLETLSFSNMSKWEEWELRGEDDGEVMPLLLELRIDSCPKLKELPSNLPPLLQKLTLYKSNVGMLSGVPLPVLPNLNHLKIRYNPELTSFPCGWLGQLKALQTLDILECLKLRSLTELQHLTMLQNLVIWMCPELRSLPVELQHLTMLQKLHIYDCPVLEERCREGGEDRYKIAHIPNIRLGRR